MRLITQMAFRESGGSVELLARIDGGEWCIVGQMELSTLYRMAKVVPRLANALATRQNINDTQSSITANVDLMEAEGFETSLDALNSIVILGIHTSLDTRTRWALKPQAALAIGEDLTSRAKELLYPLGAESRN